ncbi:hypothetical protein GCM10011371_10800 [Novosphingobium marinum]|uniref:Protein-disulfide isomerase n=1 Tax=Novosphingobium marinum TaxID=1514948 RepID=A0A7Y9XV72_9SPHN|nr:thioredoxin domain-containing protein [Novosphingobium marinum]NYH95189.1 protein-disulfide isomerase [Novosphingobium marinum]GGC25024.1 hypothetical protein GCM10011371_10800 [Novosphingobium marinum]
MRFFPIAAICAVAAISVAATDEPHANWTATVSVAESGTHTLGNPEAAVKVTEYVSYTCPHCADFQIESEAPLRLAYVQPGTVSLEVHHLLRDPVDLAAALLTNCGEPEGFFRRHNDFLGSQEQWLPKIQSASTQQRQRWSEGPVPQRMRAIAADFDFYSIMEARGFSRTRTNECLADEATMKKLLDQTQSAIESGVQGTPSFAMNGVVLEGTHTWQGLNQAIDAEIKD